MAKAKSVTQRFAQTVKSIANKAVKATRKALEPDKRSAKSRRPVVYPLAADGFVSDPMLLEPMPVVRPAKRRATKTSGRTRKPARKAGKKTTTRRSASAKKRSRAR